MPAAASAALLPDEDREKKLSNFKKFFNMGKIKKGILGGFTGKVGTVVGAYWKGIAYMRSLAGSTRNPKSAKQTQHRLKFAMLSTFLSRILGFVNIGFRDQATSMTEMDAAFKTNFQNVFSGTYPDYELLYNKLLVSKGNLEMPYSPSAVIDSQMLNVSWTDNSGIGRAEDTDQAMLLVYNSAKGQAVYSLNAGNRSERLATLTLPSAWSGDSVDIWMAMHKADTTLTSDSVYLGNFSI